MSVLVQVAEVKEIKSGTNKNGPWTLHHLIDGNGERYATFDKSLFSAAQGLVGKRVELDVKEDDKGKSFTAITEAEVSTNGDGDYREKLGTGGYIGAQKPPIEARRIAAAVAVQTGKDYAELELKMLNPQREWTPALVEETIDKWVNRLFLHLLRKGKLMEDDDIPFDERGGA